MKNLPIEIFQLIFEYLNLYDLANCKLVNKLFYNNVKEFRIKELCFYMDKDVWFYINKPIKRDRVLKNYQTIPMLKSSSFNFSCLNYLSVNCSNDVQFNLEDVNKFKNLKVLIICLKNYQNNQSTKLKLNELEILNISPADQIVELDTPNLKVLNCSEIGKIKINYPQKIKYLKTIKYSSELLIFDGLERLILYDSNNLNNLNIEHLSKLVELQVLNDQFINQLTQFIEQEKKSNRFDLKVYSNGILVANRDQITLENINKNIINSWNHDWSVNLKDYDKSADVLDWIRSVSYNSLIDSSVNQQLPVGFFRKYCNIIIIYVNDKVTNQDNLIQFIDNCRTLNKLIISNSELNQQFFDQLPVISQLEFLEIREERLKSFSIYLNFNFISKMKHFRHLITNQQISIDTIAKLDQLNCFEMVSFLICEKRVRINRFQNVYSIESDRLVCENNLKITELVDKCNHLKDRIDEKITRKINNWF